MSGLPAFLFLALLVAVVVASSVVGGLLDARRTRALGEVAQHLSLRFLGHSFEGYARAPQLEAPLFEGKFGKEIRNIMSGTRDGNSVSFFDFSYGRGRRRGSTEQTVATFTGNVPLPQFEIAPRRVPQNVDEKTFQEEIRFEDRPELARRFRLRAKDKQMVRQIFTPDALSFLEGLDSNAKWHLEGSGPTLVIYHFGKKVKPQEYSAFVEETTRIAATFLALLSNR